jgi:hypothetical protein
MHAQFQNAMAIVRKLGKPDFFITVTCNPQWPEIQRALPEGVDWHDSPSIVCRVFNMKLKRILADLREHSVLGRVQAYMYTVEFQKRGLPHAHILLIMHPEDKPREPEDVDRCVRATIPEPGDPNFTPRLRELVLANMVHGPCGSIDPKCPCMQSNRRPGKCKSNFPKEYREITSMATNSYPQYRRPPPEGDRCRVERRRKGKDYEITNADIVPYNPYLLQKYETHLNAEVCNTIDSVKYIYKYILKGIAGDQAQATAGPVDLRQDEIGRYQNYRYLSSDEAAWRMLSFCMGKMYPAVCGLQVHLPGQQRVQVPDNDPAAAQAVAAHGAPDTTLTAWLRYNSQNSDARDVLYQEMVETHSVSKKGKQDDGTLIYTWKRRNQSSFCVARMHHVDYSCREQACLRLLLTTVPGCRSFEDIRTHQGTVHDSFATAAEARGLLSDDKEFESILDDLSIEEMPYQLRNMFTRFLLFNVVSNPSALFAKFESKLTEDFKYQLAPCRDLNDKDFRLLALKDIQRTLHTRDRDFDHFCPVLYNELCDANRSGDEARVMRASDSMLPVEIQEETNYDRTKMQELIDTCEPMLNPQQEAFYSEVQNAIEDTDNRSRCYFLDSPGGTGKTFLLNLILARVRTSGRIALATASTGVAAILLEGGRTLHSRAKVPLICDTSSSCNINMRTRNGLAQLWRNTDLLICDEVSMLSRDVLECVNRMLQDLTESTLPMGGKTVVFTGDFRQCLPVIPRAGRGEIVEKSFKNSPLYRHFKRCSLTVNMRVQRLLAAGDVQQAAAANKFSNFLLDLGNGKRPIKFGKDWVEMPESMVLQSNDIMDLVKRVYPNLASHARGDGSWLSRRAILAARNADVRATNSQILDMWPGHAIDLFSADNLFNPEDRYNCTQEFLHKQCISGVPDHHLRLKTGVPLLLTTNISFEDGACNGTRLIFDEIVNQNSRNLLRCRIMNGPSAGKVILINRIDVIQAGSAVSGGRGLPWPWVRRAFPVKLAFCCTINKSQGQTLDMVGVILTKPVFTHGQTYVAASRVGDAGSVCFLIPKAKEDRERRLTRNVVYHEVLSTQVGDPPAPSTPAASLSHPDCGMVPAEEGSLRAKMVGCNGLPPQTGQGPFGIGDEEQLSPAPAPTVLASAPAPADYLPGPEDMQWDNDQEMALDLALDIHDAEVAAAAEAGLLMDEDDT